MVSKIIADKNTPFHKLLLSHFHAFGNRFPSPNNCLAFLFGSF